MRVLLPALVHADAGARLRAGQADEPADALRADRLHPHRRSHGPNKTIYISGQIAYDKDGKLVGAGDMQAQAEQVFKNLEAALTAAGAKFSDVVKMNSYITDMSRIQAVRDVRARYFKDSLPASTFVQVAGLVRPDLLLEIEVVAVLPAR